MSSAVRRSWTLVGALALAAFAAPLGCGPTGAGGPDDAEVAAELAQVGVIVRARLATFRTAVAALDAAVDAWAAADAGETERAAAQEAWRTAFLAWQELEVLQIGPAASSLSAVGGEDVRDRVYAWPTVAPCKVDQQTVYGDFADAGWADAALVDLVGLDALETLLFSPAGENACFGGVDINKDGTWDALGADGAQQARAAYAAVLAADLVARADALVEAWDPAGGDWGGKLAAAGSADSPYGSRAEALDAVFAALFYLETSVKDRKLGKVLGLTYCEAASCPEDVEAKLADASVDAVLANLEGFEALFTGEDGAGLDDVLVAAGHADVADAVTAALATAKTKVGALTIPLEDAATDPATREAFDAVKALTDLLKGDVATVLSLTIPAEAAGDND